MRLGGRESEARREREHHRGMEGMFHSHNIHPV